MRGHIRKRGRNSFEIKYDIDRADGRRQTRYRSFKGTRREATAELNRLLAQVADGGHVDPSKVTVAEYLRSRLEIWRAKGEVSAKPAERYGQLIRAQVEPFIGATPLQKLTEEEVEWWHTKLLTEGRHDKTGGVSTRTIRDAHRVVSKALSEAVRHKLVPRNVCTFQPPPKVVSKKMRILTPEQVAGFADLLDGHELAALAVTALFTGMRRGELLALNWGNVDFAAKIIRVRKALEETNERGVQIKETPKTEAGVRDIKLPDIVIETLQAHRKHLLERRMQLGLGKLTDTDWVFPNGEGSLRSPDQVSDDWGELSRELGLGISFHELRHTHASQLIDEGIDVVMISKRLGHATPSVTLTTYAHLFQKDDSKAADAINKALKG
jgi:integrase